MAMRKWREAQSAFESALAINPGMLDIAKWVQQLKDRNDFKEKRDKTSD